MIDRERQSIELAAMSSGGLLDSDVREKQDLPNFRGTKKPLRLMTIWGLFLIIAVAAVTKFTTFKGADSPQCQSIYMYPAYALIDGFDERYTSLAKKYHLYLYREQGQDKVPLNDNGDEIVLNGIPVLFIPGNAGSFKQVRSIAAGCSNIYFNDFGSLDNKDTQNLDFFAADFNEDFTAFHGRTMMDQAEYLNDAIRYILSLYEQTADSSSPKPESVIIVGHSMGGMVARIIPGLQNYVYGSINTIITLSTPHGAAPVTFDGDILKIYQTTNEYWIQQYKDENSFFSKNMSLFSITGGILDDVLPADYVFVKDFLPEENGFSTFTTTIQKVWTPIDHLAVVWCNQLRNVVAKLLLEIVDKNIPNKTKPLDYRVSKARELLLSGFEENRPLLNANSKSIDIPSNKYADYKTIHPSNEGLVLTGNQLNDFSKGMIIDIAEMSNSDEFSFLTNIDKVTMYLCDEKFKTFNDNKVGFMECKDVTSYINLAPMKVTNPSSDESIKSYKIVNITKQMSLGKSKLIMDFPNHNNIANDIFINFKITSIENSRPININHTPYYLTFFSNSVKIDNQKWIYYENIWDSLISYKLKTKLLSGKKEELEFQPFIRQWIGNRYETKWHNNILDSEVDITMHNTAPFIPISDKKYGLNLMVYAPENASIQVSLKINWSMTLKQLFIRFRLVIGTFPVFIVSSAFAYQLYLYNKTSVFIDFKVALSYLLVKYGVIVVVSMLLLSPLIDTKLGQYFIYRLDPIRINTPMVEGIKNMTVNNYLLGLRSVYVSWIGPLFMSMSFGLVSFLVEVILGIETIIRKIKGPPNTNPPKSKDFINKVVFDRRRTLASLSLLALIVLYIPYQIAFSVVLAVQLATSFKICLTVPESHPGYLNLRNYNFSVLLLFIFVFIINAPVMIVFLHNVAIRWETPFRSHHNVLAVAPIIFLTSANSTLNMPSFGSNKFLHGGLLVVIMSYLGFFSLIYGIRNMYWIHHIVNIFCGWLLLGFMKGD
ncbi:hypothetical protein TPHA_0P00270 [Tetrapisispora phaffii CBS 4417]|uniref:GPI inositol-deacylase n=1 Tax=Tetrapisispora phaffii (strain ATCC 24235 / CBS 4417 / NBRC 1672 / NRRL Y-8282 / UCD 70-5) TaxID=1071381 RepID=G8C207_TETPH|nr:hypothetical protein TPHA_0P00270 [Tetrapisispora phaffii CBS 4417]CCE66185.1 hypothetical protein TPHA_0P00270 [Tetrapisispora phaffii CBS 4417]